MSKLMDLLYAFLEEDEWNPQRHPEEELLRVGYSGDSGQWQCFARTRSDVQVMFYSMCPVTTPEERRTAMAEYITRANYGLVIGNFELDFRDGEVRYKTSIDLERIPIEVLEANEWGKEIFKDLTYPNVLMMDRYLPGILRVIAGSEDPADVIAEIEGDE